MKLTQKQQIDALMQVCDGRDLRVLRALLKKPLVDEKDLEVIERIKRKNPTAVDFLERVSA